MEDFDISLLEIENSDDYLKHLDDFTFDTDLLSLDEASRNLAEEISKLDRTKRYHCSVCKRKFLANSQLQRHLIFHSTRKDYKCGLCKKLFFLKENLDEHVNFHSGADCDICGRTFYRKQKLIKHIMRHTHSFRCFLCPETVQSHYLFDLHLNSHSTPEIDEYLTEFDKITQSRDVSGYNYPYFKNLRESAKVFTNIEEPSITSSGKNYDCPGCKARFHFMKDLDRHITTHPGLKLYECKQCRRKFSAKTSLRRHSASMHVFKPKLPCYICRIVFVNRYELRRHFLSHLGRKPYSCLICGNVFNKKRDQEEHERDHGKNTYHCKWCKAEFKFESNLIKHIATHSQYKPFSCSKCCKTYTTNDALKIHLKTHHEDCTMVKNNEKAIRKFICAVCHTMFVRKTSLMRHICKSRCGASVSSESIGKDQTEGKMTPSIECLICKRKFLNKDNMLRHRKSHFTSWS